MIPNEFARRPSGLPERVLRVTGRPFRSCEGIGGISFELTRRAGRMTLAAEDLLQKAINKDGMATHAVYCPAKSEKILFGDDGDDALRNTIGRKSVSDET